jgi:hypothetical protein
LRRWEVTEASRAIALGGMESLAFGEVGVQGGVKKPVRALVIKAPKRYVMALWSADAVYDRIAASIKPVRP